MHTLDRIDTNALRGVCMHRHSRARIKAHTASRSHTPSISPPARGLTGPEVRKRRERGGGWTSGEKMRALVLQVLPTTVRLKWKKMFSLSEPKWCFSEGGKQLLNWSPHKKRSHNRKFSIFFFSENQLGFVSLVTKPTGNILDSDKTSSKKLLKYEVLDFATTESKCV